MYHQCCVSQWVSPSFAVHPLLHRSTFIVSLLVCASSFTYEYRLCCLTTISSGTCRSPTTSKCLIGEICPTPNGAADCSSGACTSTGTTLYCMARLSDGSSCTSATDCQSNHCCGAAGSQGTALYFALSIMPLPHFDHLIGMMIVCTVLQCNMNDVCTSASECSSCNYPTICGHVPNEHTGFTGFDSFSLLSAIVCMK